jgi:hypothetical protein
MATSKDTLTFSKCKLGLENLYFYFNDIVCVKIFINIDHIKIITYDDFKLPLKLLNEFLKELGFIIYIEIQSETSGKSTSKMFRTVESKILCNFNDIKKQFPNKITCCMNNKGLKIPGCFKISEFINVAKDFIDYFKMKNSVNFINIPQEFPILPTNSVSIISTNATLATTASIITSTTNIVEPIIVEPIIVKPIVESSVEPIIELVESKIENIEKNETKIEIPKVINTENNNAILKKVEVQTNKLSESERKLAIAESEIRVAQMKHNIAYLEYCLQQELDYHNTL